MIPEPLLAPLVNTALAPLFDIAFLALVALLFVAICQRPPAGR